MSEETKKTRIIFTAAQGIKNFGAALIRYFDNTPFSHVGFLDADDIIYEATMSGGIVMTSLSDFQKTGYPYIICEVDSADYLACREKAASLMNSGLSYDKKMISKMFFRRMPIFSALSGKIQPTKHGRICSGLVCEILQEGGVQIVKDFNTLLAVPRDVYLDPAVKVVGGNDQGLAIDSKYINDIKCTL